MVHDRRDIHGWQAFEAAQPEFAARVRERFRPYRHHVLATLRADGSPRVTCIEVDFRFGEVWLGMMANSRKALDLRRDPRFSLQANPGPDASLDDPDVRLSGRAAEVRDPAVLARHAGEEQPAEPFHLFRLAFTEAVAISVEGDDLVVRVWQPGRPLRTIRRGNDDGPPREDPAA